MYNALYDKDHMPTVLLVYIHVVGTYMYDIYYSSDSSLKSYYYSSTAEMIRRCF